MSRRIVISIGMAGTFLALVALGVHGCDRAKGTSDGTTRPTDPNDVPRPPAEPIKQLFAAISAQDAAEVERLLAQHPDLLEKEQYGERPLWRACRSSSNSLAVVKPFVERGASLTAVNAQKQTVLCAAVKSDNVELVRYLIAKGADPKVLQDDNESLLWSASTRQMARVLLDAGVDPKHASALGDHAINFACKLNLKDVVEELLAAGVDIEAPGRYDMRPLHSAAASIRGNPEPLVKMLLDRGAKIDAPGFEGMTPLHDCANFDRYRMAAYLLARGALVTSKDRRGRTPADLAKLTKADRIPMLELLYRYGDTEANPNPPPKQ